MSHVQRSYDHQLRDLVRRTGDVTLATSAGVPRSTASGWLRGRSRPTVTLDVLSIEEEKLQAEVLRLRKRVEKLRALARILVATIQAFDLDLEHRRIPGAISKSVLMRAVERGRQALRLRPALAVIGLSPSRFHAWRRAARGCDLDDHSSCPKVSPHRLTSGEVQTIKEMVTSPDYRHVPTGTLAILARSLLRASSASIAKGLFHLLEHRSFRGIRGRVHPSPGKCCKLTKRSSCNAAWCA